MWTKISNISIIPLRGVQVVIVLENEFPEGSYSPESKSWGTWIKVGHEVLSHAELLRRVHKAPKFLKLSGVDVSGREALMSFVPI